MSEQIRSLGANSGIAAIAPTAGRGMLAINAELNWSTTVTGSDNAYFRGRDWTLASGREFTDAELRSGGMACIVGATVREKLFGAQDPLDASIRLGALACPVIGVLSKKGQASFGADQDELVVIPLRAFQRRIAGNSTSTACWSRCARTVRPARCRPTSSSCCASAAGWARARKPIRRRHRHHEHHAGVGHRAHPRDRRAPRDRRHGGGRPAPVPGRGGDSATSRRAARRG